MPLVAYPIHESKRNASQMAIETVVLQDNRLAGNATGLAEKCGGINGVMKNVDEGDDIETCVGKRDLGAIERRDRDAGQGTYQNVYALDSKIRAHAAERCVDQAIPAAHINNPRIAGDQLRDPPCQHLYASPADVPLVNVVESLDGKRRLDDWSGSRVTLPPISSTFVSVTRTQ